MLGKVKSKVCPALKTALRNKEKGTLLYTILPIHEAVNYHLERQLAGLPSRKGGRKKR